MTTGIARIQHFDIGGTRTDVNVLTAFQGDEIFVETKPIDFGVPDRNKELQCLIFNITQRGNITDLSCSIGYNQRIEDSITWAGPYSLAAMDAPLWVRLPQSRYFYLKVVDALPQVTWKLSNIEAYGRILDPNSGAGPKGRF